MIGVKDTTQRFANVRAAGSCLGNGADLKAVGTDTAAIAFTNAN